MSRHSTLTLWKFANRRNKCHLLIIPLLLVPIYFRLWYLSFSKSNIDEPIEIVLDELIHKSPYKEPLIFTITNAAYNDFTKNWILSLNIIGMNNFNVICVDTECKEDLIKWNEAQNKTKIDPTQIIIFDLNQTPSFGVYGTSAFTQFTKHRAKIIQYFYQMHYEKFNEDNSYRFDSVLYLDSDMVILRNFAVSLHEDGYYEFDIIVQNDASDKDAGWCKETKFADFTKLNNICSCFILIPFNKQRHDAVINFLGKWNEKMINMNAGGTIQPPFNSALRNNPNKEWNVGVVRCSEYPSGWLLMNAKWTQDSYWNNSDKTIKIIHANWIVGESDKKSFLQKYNAWF